jgi:hypothetical protein
MDSTSLGPGRLHVGCWFLFSHRAKYLDTARFHLSEVQRSPYLR